VFRSLPRVMLALVFAMAASGFLFPPAPAAVAQTIYRDSSRPSFPSEGILHRDPGPALQDTPRAPADGPVPVAVATTAAILLVREGLEAVLVLAALMSSMKTGESRRLRRPMWLGVAAACVATLATWMVARTVLTALADYDETLSAVVSLMAVAVLLLVLNWYFFRVYWSGWIGAVNARKRQVIGGVDGQTFGLATLGFVTVYREGFETVLFLQALALEGGIGPVLAGVAAGLAAVAMIAWATLVMQARLPYKRMLIATGVLIAAVLVVMVGNTLHGMQEIGWLPEMPQLVAGFPEWPGAWLGIYPQVATLAGQALAAVYVVGTYLLAEWQNRKRSRPPARAIPLS
jgi:high-affinity iron transporter